MIAVGWVKANAIRGQGTRPNVIPVTLLQVQRIVMVVVMPAARQTARMGRVLVSMGAIMEVERRGRVALGPTHEYRKTYIG